jgi:solute carrier family 50 protein (sugar transporter)
MGIQHDPIIAWGLWTVHPVIEAVLGWLGAFVTMLFVLSPYKVIQTTLKEKSTRQFRGEVFVTGILNCGLWSYYTYNKEEWQPFIGNVTNTVIEIIFLVLFLLYCRPKTRLKLVSSLIAALIVIVLLCYLTTVFGIEDVYGGDNLTTVATGMVASVANILMYASPLAAVKRVIRTSSVKYMPITITLGSLSTSLIWAVYAVYLGDIFILAPNSVGVVLSLLQLAVYMTYVDRDSQDGEYGPLPNDHEKDVLTVGIEESPEDKLLTDNTVDSSAIIVIDAAAATPDHLSEPLSPV